MNNNDSDWEVKPLISLVEKRKGKKPTGLTDKYTEGSIPYIDIEAFEKGVIKRYTTDKTAPVASEKDVLVVWDGARCGLSGMAQGAIGSTLMKLTPKDIEPEYLLIFLQSKYKEINTNPRGTGIPHVEPDLFWSMEVPVPDESIRKAIISKYKSVLPGIDKAQKKILRARLLIHKFRQSVLAAAVNGKLTEGWRENNNPEYESNLLDLVKVHGESVPEKFAGNNDWRGVALECLLPKRGIFDGPFGSNLKTSDYTESGVRVIRLENIGNIEFIASKETYVSDEKYKSLIQHTVGEGDLLVASFISGGVRATILPSLLTKAIAKADCFCVRPNEKCINKKYLLYTLSSPQMGLILSENIHGATRPRINTKQLKKAVIPLPSLKEQNEIVKRLESLLNVATMVEQQVATVEKKTDRLVQSILAKAFRGELI